MASTITSIFLAFSRNTCLISFTIVILTTWSSAIFIVIMALASTMAFIMTSIFLTFTRDTFLISLAIVILTTTLFAIVIVAFSSIMTATILSTIFLIFVTLLIAFIIVIGTSLVRISNSIFFTRTNSLMSDDFAVCIFSTSILARILTFSVDARNIRQAVRIQYTFWSTIGWLTDVSFLALGSFNDRS